MNFEDLPQDIIYKITDTDVNDNKTLLNLSLTSKKIKFILNNNIETRRRLILYYNECIQRGERYKRMNEIYNKYKLLEGFEIFKLLIDTNDARQEIFEWYSLLKENDVIFEDRFWMDDNNEYIYKNVEILKKGISYKYPLKINIDKHELLLNVNPKTFIGIKTSARILIPPRTDIIIE